MNVLAPLESRGGPAAARWRLSSRQQSLFGVLVILVLVPIAFRMDPAKFKIFVDEQSWEIWRFIGQGVLTVFVVSTAAILLSLPVAIALTLGRLSTHGYVRVPAIAFVEGVRAIPLLLLIFYVFLSMPRDVPLPVGREFLALTLALMVYTAAINAETLRAGILALERGQMEAARSLGLNYWGALRFVILPQAFRNTLPALIAQFTTLVKDTSLGQQISLIELVARGVIIYQGFRNPMESLYVIALVYFALNFALDQVSLAAQRNPN